MNENGLPWPAAVRPASRPGASAAGRGRGVRAPFLLTLALLAGISAKPEAQPLAQDHDSMRELTMGRLHLFNLQPSRGNFVYGAARDKNGITEREFTLSAGRGRFAYYDATGTKPLLTGAMTEFHAKGWRRPYVDAEHGPELVFERTDDLSFILRPETVESIDALAGGRLDIKQPKIWVGNSDRVSTTDRGGTGRLHFEAAGLTWNHATFNLPAPLGQVSATLRNSDAHAGAAFEFSLDKGELRLVRGRFRGKLELPSVPRDFEIGVYSGHLQDLAGRTLTATVRDREIDVDFEGLAAHGSVVADLGVPIVASGAFELPALGGTGTLATGAVALERLRVGGLRFTPAGRFSGHTADLGQELEELLAKHRLDSPASGQLRAIATTRTGLAALTAPNFLVHLPKREILELLGATLSDIHAPVAPRVDFNKQEISVELNLARAVHFGQRTMDLQAVLHVAPSVDGQTLVLQPSVSLLALPRLKLEESFEPGSFLGALRDGVKLAAEGFASSAIKVPLDLRVSKRLDPAGLPSGPNFAVTANPIDLRVSITNVVVLIDDAGLHVLGTVEETV
jgi:hypothetical protein